MDERSKKRSSVRPAEAGDVEFLVRAMEEWHIPTVLVSHGQDEVRRLADWVYVIEGGSIVGQGTPSEALP